MMLSRRGLLGWLGGGAALLAAPAIVRCGSLMPVKAWPVERVWVTKGPHGSVANYVAGEPIPLFSAVSLGPDGRVYLCNDKERFAGVAIPTYRGVPITAPPDWQGGVPVRVSS